MLFMMPGCIECISLPVTTPRQWELRSTLPPHHLRFGAVLSNTGSRRVLCGSLQGRESSTRRKLLFPTHSNLYIAVVRSLNRGFLIAELEFVNHCFGN